MLFVSALITYIIKFIAFVIVGGLGIYLGITLRKRKNNNTNQ